MSAAKALIIEDDEAHAALLQRTLEAEGFATDTATGVAAAQRRLDSDHWDLVTLDTTLLPEKIPPLAGRPGLARYLADLNIVFLCVTPQPPELLPHDILLAGPFAHVPKDGRRGGLAAAVRKARSVKPEFRRLCIEDALYRLLPTDARLQYRERAYEQVSPWLEQYCAKEGVECVALSGAGPQVLWAGHVLDLPHLGDLERMREDPGFPVFVFGRTVIVRRAVIGTGNGATPRPGQDYLVTLRAKLGARDWPPEQVHRDGLEAYGEFDTGGPFCLVQAGPAHADRILGDQQVDRWANIGGVDIFHQCGPAAVLLGTPEGHHCAGVCRCGLVTQGRLRDAMRDWPDDFNALLGRDILFRLDVEVILDGRRRTTAVPAADEELDWREVTQG